MHCSTAHVRGGVKQAHVREGVKQACGMIAKAPGQDNFLPFGAGARGKTDALSTEARHSAQLSQPAKRIQRLDFTWELIFLNRLCSCKLRE